MRLPRILNQCHPIPGFVYGQASFAEDEQAILIPVRPRKRSRAICSGCHQPAAGYDQSDTPRLFEFIGFWGYLVFLVYCMRRVECSQCGVVVEEVPWGVGKHSSTKVYMHFLGHWARKLSWKETAEEFRTSWDKVHDALAYLVAWGLEHRVVGAIRAIGVDESLSSAGPPLLQRTLFPSELRRGELAALTVAHLQQRDGRWVICDVLGKGGRVRSVPIAAWIQCAIDRWTEAAAITPRSPVRPSP